MSLSLSVLMKVVLLRMVFVCFAPQLGSTASTFVKCLANDNEYFVFCVGLKRNGGISANPLLRLLLLLLIEQVAMYVLFSLSPVSCCGGDRERLEANT